MPLITPITRLELTLGNWAQQAGQWLAGGLVGHSYSPEGDLAAHPGVDPRLLPRVPMQSHDIDVALLGQLSNMGFRRGKLVTAQSHPELYAQWEIMSRRAGFKRTPQLILAESKAINAATVSPEEVVMTTGLLKRLDYREVVSVLGHELGHGSSEHTKPRAAATLLYAAAGLVLGLFVNSRVRFLPDKAGLLLAETEGLVALGTTLTLASTVSNQISVRPTEYQADLRGAAISGDPQGLASALRKLGETRKDKPFSRFLSQLLSGYPATDARVRNLEQLASEWAQQGYVPQPGKPIARAAQHVPGTAITQAQHGDMLAPDTALQAER